MIDVLAAPETRRTVFPVSVEFYHEAGRLGLIGEDVELLEGVIFTKMPKSPFHEWLVEVLRELLAIHCGNSFHVGKERPLTCRHSEPEPDLAVLRGSPADYRFQHPTTAELVIEVAINTQQRDRIKAGIYAGAGVKEYWLIEPEAGLVTLHMQPQGDAYEAVRSFQPEEEAVSTVFPGFALRLADLMA